MTSLDRIADLTAALVGLRMTIADGALIDLNGLEGAIGEAMDAARAALGQDRAELRPALLTLAAELDHLAAALARQHHAGDQQRATAAYGGATGRSKPAGQPGQTS
jgi:hypothetical protein